MYLNCNEWEHDFSTLSILLDNSYVNNFIVMGDLNIRISNNQKLPKEYKGFKFKLKRESKDKEFNQRGNKFIELCDNHNLVILNGRTPGDKDGNFTYISGQGCSVNDLCCVSLDWIDTVCDFKVENEIYSDHMPIVMYLDLYTQQLKQQLLPLLPKVPWTKQDERFFKNKLNLKVSSQNQIPEKDRISVLIAMIKDCAFGGNNNNFNQHYQASKNKWFDTECRKLRNSCFKKLNLFRKSNLTSDKELYVKTKVEYKKLCIIKKTNYYTDLCNSFSQVRDSKHFWELANSLKFSKYVSGNSITPEQWINHFMSLLNPVRKPFDINYVPNIIIDESLDKPFEMLELKRALQKAKSGKAPGSDRIPYEFYKNSSENYLEELLELYNNIYDSGDIPENFQKSIIFPLFKKNDINAVENYRGISFLNTIAKLFTGMLLTRITEWSNSNNILSENQAGFRKGYSTIDNIFNLINIIKTKTTKKRSKVYAFFIDFCCAFDSPDRNAIFYKLTEIGFSTKIIKILEALYKNTEAAIWTKDGFTQSFETKSGLKQGCLLSPILFSLFINDFPKCIGSGLQWEGKSINCLMFADDIVLLANDPSTLQQMINKVENYCDTWGLNINLEKSKIMIFRKRGKLAKKESWRYKNSKIEIVKAYKYLGFMMTPQLSIKEQLIEKIKVAKFSILCTWKKLLNNNAIPPNSKFNVYNSVCRAIVSYSAETWGFEFPKELEKFQKFFLKRMFSLPYNCPDYVLYLEINKEPLTHFTYCLHLRYINKILTLPNNRLPKEIAEYIIKNNLFWHKNNLEIYQKLTGKTTFIYSHDQISELLLAMKIDFRKQIINKVASAKFHLIYKELNFQLDDKHYINNNRKQHFMNTIIRIRCEHLGLNYSINRSEEQLFCSMCNLKEIEDTLHFIGICPVLKEFRLIHFGKPLLSTSEVMDYLNGKEWDCLYKYTTLALKYRTQMIKEFNF